MSPYYVSNPDSPRRYENWLIVDEVDYMMTDSNIRKKLSSFKDIESYDSQDLEVDYTREIKPSEIDKLVYDKIDQINKETNDDIEKIRTKLSQIEGRWDQENIKKYIENKNTHPQFSKIDELLGLAMVEVAEIHKGANMAVQELTKSVENVDNLYSKTTNLRDSTDTFRMSTIKEKNSQPMSLKTQLCLALLSFITFQFVMTILS